MMKLILAFFSLIVFCTCASSEQEPLDRQQYEDFVRKYPKEKLRLAKDLCLRGNSNLEGDELKRCILGKLRK